MFGTSQSFQNMNTMDPLTTQFMSQGQMGYMPQAQYLTSAEYGAYRTMPGMATGMDTTQSLSMWQAYVQASRGGVMGLNPYTIGSYNPMVNQTANIIKARRQLSDQQGILLSTGAGIGLSTIGGMAGFALGGPIGAVAGTAIGSMIDPGSMLADRTRNMRAIQQMSMPSMVVGSDMSATLGKGFTSQAAGRLNEFIKKEAVSDFAFNEKDYMSFLGKGVQHGLMAYSSSSAQYGESIKNIRKNVKAMAAFLENKDVAAIFKDMERIQTMGATMKDAGSVAVMESLFARTVGVSHQEMVDTYGQQGAMQYTQRGMTGIHGSLQAMANAASIVMSQRLGLTGAAEVSRAGGISGLTQRLTDGDTRADELLKKIYIPGLMSSDGSLNLDTLKAIQSRKMSFEELAKRSLSNSGTMERSAINLQNRNKILSEVQENLGPVGMTMFRAQWAEELGRQVLPKGDRRSQLYMGMRVLKYDEQAAYHFSNKMDSTEHLEGLLAQSEAHTRQLKMEAMSEIDDANSFLNRKIKGFRAATNFLGVNTIGRVADAWNTRSDRKDEASIGLYQTDMTGINTSFGLVGAEITAEEYALAEDQLRKNDADHKALKFKEDFLNSSTVVVDTKATGEYLDINPMGMQVWAKTFAEGDISEEGIAKKYAKLKGIPIELARAILQGDGGKSYAYISQTVVGQGSDEFLRALERDVSKGRRAQEERTRDFMNNQADEVRNRISMITGRTALGFRDTAHTTALKEVFSDSGMGAGDAEAMYALQVLLNSKPIVDDVGNAFFSTEAKAGIEKYATKLGLSQEIINELMEGGNLSSFEDAMGAKGLKAGLFGRSLEVAKHKGGLIGSPGDISNFTADMEALKEYSRVVQVMGATLNTQNLLNDNLYKGGHGGDARSLLNSPERRRELLDNSGISQELRDQVEAIEKLSKPEGADTHRNVSMSEVGVDFAIRKWVSTKFSADTFADAPGGQEGAFTDAITQNIETSKMLREAIEKATDIGGELKTTLENLNSTSEGTKEVNKELSKEMFLRNARAPINPGRIFGNIFR